MKKPFPSPDPADHVRRDTRTATGSLTGVIAVNPYCAHCNTAWPCPTIAIQQSREATA